MKNNKFLLTLGAIALVSAGSFGINYSNSYAEEKSDKEIQQEVVAETRAVPDVAVSNIEKSKVNIPLDLEKKQIEHIKGKAFGVRAEKREGGYMIESWYPTDTENGDLLVAQSVNEKDSVQGMLDEMPNWYPEELGGYKVFKIAGIQAVLNENAENANTLHLITDTEIYTVAFQKTGMLMKVATEIANEIKK